MESWTQLDHVDKIFILWAFLLLLLLIVHFSIRKVFFSRYTLRFGWIVYALCIPAVAVSLLMIQAGRDWSFWLGGFLFLGFAIFGYLVDYRYKFQFRKPFKPSIGIPYVLMYLAAIMFYWWPLTLIRRPLWYVYATLFIISTMLNVTSHKNPAMKRN